MNNEIINEFSDEYIKLIKTEFSKKYKLKISNFLNDEFAEKIFKYSFLEKNWVLATGIDKMKYEKKQSLENDKINQTQIKNVNKAFGKGSFAYIFYRSMNNKNMSYIEFSIRKILNSEFFINFLNNITGLQLTKLNTLFLSKYKSGNFLSPHSDKGNGTLAFVINLTKFWKPQYGGNLCFMNEDRTEIIDTIVPEFNSFFIFHVPEEKGIPHFVSHVAPNIEHSRFAITGWFI